MGSSCVLEKRIPLVAVLGGVGAVKRLTFCLGGVGAMVPVPCGNGTCP